MLLEDAATGRALITSDVPGCRDAVDEGIKGYLCKMKSAEGLYQKMRKFMELTEERKEMGKTDAEKSVLSLIKRCCKENSKRIVKLGVEK